MIMGYIILLYKLQNKVFFPKTETLILSVMQWDDHQHDLFCMPSN